MGIQTDEQGRPVDWVKQTTFVYDGDELVEISIREYNIMMLRGHLIPVYGQAARVKHEACFGRRKACSISTTKEV